MNGGDLNENVDAAGMQNGMQKAKAPLTEDVLVHVELALEVRADHVELVVHEGAERIHDANLKEEENEHEAVPHDDIPSHPFPYVGQVEPKTFCKD